LLAAAGILFSVRVRPVEERRCDGESPEAYVQRLAYEKAAAARLDPSEIVLGADTVVVLDDVVLEKPKDEADALAMLELLSGRQHVVMTGICLLHPGGKILDISQTSVRFAKLEAEEVAEYIATGEPMDKAGAYAIQGWASRFVERIDGCYFNVVGLPVHLVYGHLKNLVP